MLTSRKSKPQRGLIGVASHFNGWYKTAMNMRAFRYATSNPYRVPKGTHPLTITLPAVLEVSSVSSSRAQTAGYPYQMPTASLPKLELMYIHVTIDIYFMLFAFLT